MGIDINDLNELLQALEENECDNECDSQDASVILDSLLSNKTPSSVHRDSEYPITFNRLHEEKAVVIQREFRRGKYYKQSTQVLQCEFEPCSNAVEHGQRFCSLPCSRKFAVMVRWKNKGRRTTTPGIKKRKRCSRCQQEGHNVLTCSTPPSKRLPLQPVQATLLNTNNVVLTQEQYSILLYKSDTFDQMFINQVEDPSSQLPHFSSSIR